MADKEELYLRQANPHRAWYVIHTYSGYENKVKANLERLMHSASMSEMIFNVVVPVENEIEVKDGKEKVVPRKVFPGYVLVDMIVDDPSHGGGGRTHSLRFCGRCAEAPHKGECWRHGPHRFGRVRGLCGQDHVNRLVGAARAGRRGGDTPRCGNRSGRTDLIV